MESPNGHDFGRFCWFELTTLDLAASKAFYRDLFGWRSIDLPNEPDGPYAMQTLDGRTVSAITEMTAEQRRHGLPAHWMCHIYTGDIYDTVDQAQSLGARLFLKPSPIVENGYKAIIQDPQGGLVALWQPKSFQGVDHGHVSGSINWCELTTRDTDGAAAFYCSLFDWEVDHQELNGVRTHTFSQDGQKVAGMVDLQEDLMDVPPHWGMFFTVTDCQAVVQKTIDRGGKVILSPAPLTGNRQFAALSDPHGAMFYIIQY